MRYAAVLAAGFMLAACAMGEVPDGDDKGGSVLAYAARIAAQDGPVEITGYCSSACGMWLSYPGACIRLPATFGFHRVAADYTGQMQRVYDAHLPSGLRAWYRANVPGTDIVRLSGAAIIRNGWARECGE